MSLGVALLADVPPAYGEPLPARNRRDRVLPGGKVGRGACVTLGRHAPTVGGSARPPLVVPFSGRRGYRRGSRLRRPAEECEGHHRRRQRVLWLRRRRLTRRPPLRYGAASLRLVGRPLRRIARLGERSEVGPEHCRRHEFRARCGLDPLATDRRERPAQLGSSLDVDRDAHVRRSWQDSLKAHGIAGRQSCAGCNHFGFRFEPSASPGARRF